jgi:hypothetical protein
MLQNGLPDALQRFPSLGWEFRQVFLDSYGVRLHEVLLGKQVNDEDFCSFIISRIVLDFVMDSLRIRRTKQDVGVKTSSASYLHKNPSASYLH